MDGLSHQARNCGLVIAAAAAVTWYSCSGPRPHSRCSANSLIARSGVCSGNTWSSSQEPLASRRAATGRIGAGRDSGRSAS